MKNKPLIAAAGFALAAFIFLLWGWGYYKSAAADLDDAIYQWDNSKGSRDGLVQLVETAPPPSEVHAAAGSANVPDVMQQLLETNGLNISQLDRIDPAGALPTELSANTVRLSGISIAVMGKMLEQIHTQHPGLAVREIQMAEPKNPTPAVFNWTLIVGVAKPRT